MGSSGGAEIVQAAEKSSTSTDSRVNAHIMHFFMKPPLNFDIKDPPAPKNRGILIKQQTPPPFSAEAVNSYRVGVLTFTAGGTVPEFHRLALLIKSLVI